MIFVSSNLYILCNTLLCFDALRGKSFNTVMQIADNFYVERLSCYNKFSVFWSEFCLLKYIKVVQTDTEKYNKFMKFPLKIKDTCFSWTENMCQMSNALMCSDALHSNTFISTVTVSKYNFRFLIPSINNTENDRKTEELLSYDSHIHPLICIPASFFDFQG